MRTNIPLQDARAINVTKVQPPANSPKCLQVWLKPLDFVLPRYCPDKACSSAPSCMYGQGAPAEMHAIPKTVPQDDNKSEVANNA